MPKTRPQRLAGHALATVFILALTTACQSRSGHTAQMPGPSATQILAEQRAMSGGHLLLGTVAGLDPTGLSGIAMGKARQKQQMRWRESVMKRQVSGLPEKDQEIMMRYMKANNEGHPGAEGMKRELFEHYGIDKNGNPPQ